MVTIALFCALAYVVMFVFRVNVSFLTFDVKDAVITICGLIFGPIAALISAFTVAFLELITVSDTGVYGFLMNFISSAAFSCTAALVYKYKRKMSGAAIGLLAAVFSTTATMLVFNIIITPLFMKVDRAIVFQMIPTLLLPFNATKAVFNAALVLFFYKPVSTALKAAKVIKTPEATNNNNKNSIWQTVITCAIGLSLIAASVLVFVFVLDGQISWF